MSAHETCTGSFCDIECISDIKDTSDLYLDELYRVLFLRDNILQRSHWLSIFYSLAVHGYARRIITELAKTNFDCMNGNDIPRKIKEHLHITVRLFIAASSSYDPLTLNYSNVGDTGVLPTDDNVKQFQLAQHAVGFSEWRSKGIYSSADYLLQIFGDDGGDLEISLGQIENKDLSSLYVVNHLSIDGITNPQVGGFQCTHPGCNAQPFHTQVSISASSYLRNYNANYGSIC